MATNKENIVDLERDAHMIGLSVYTWGNSVVGSDTVGTEKSADGSFGVLLQHSRPDGKLAVSRLPTPNEPLHLSFSFYQPHDGRYRLPHVEVRSFRGRGAASSGKSRSRDLN
jgi:hypothetical protein